MIMAAYPVAFRPKHIIQREPRKLREFGPNVLGTSKIMSWAIRLSVLLATPLFSSPVYQLSTVVKSGDTIGGIQLQGVGDPSLNNNGHVGFFGFYAGTVGIFTSTSGLEVSLGAVIDGITLEGGFGASSPILNDSGTLAFMGNYAGGSGIFTQSSVLAKQGDTISGKTLNGVTGGWAFNNKGVAAFTGTYTLNGNPSGGVGIFSQTTNIVKRGDTISGLTLTAAEGNHYSLNDQGTLAFEGSFGPCCSAPTSGIFTQYGVLAKTGDVIDGKTFLSGFGQPSINNNGKAVFRASYSDSSTSKVGIFTQDSIVVKPGDIVSGKTITSLGFFPVINDMGTVVYLGNFTQGSGIFTQDGMIVKTGDQIDGKTLTGFGSFLSLNQHDTLAFRGTFSDGSSAILLARPQTVPEPGTVWIAAMGLSTILLLKRPRKNL